MYDLETKQQINIVLEELYSNNEEKLRQKCQKEMAKFGGITQKDYDDFYSKVGYEIAHVIKYEKYDPSCEKTFKDYISGVIKLAICKEMTHRNRQKRQTIIEKEEKDSNGNVVKKKEYVSNISIDTPIGEDSNMTIGDTLQSDFDMDNKLGLEECFEENTLSYLKILSPTQRKIAKLIMDGYSSSEIKEKMNLSDKQYENHMKYMRCFEKTSILTRNNNIESEEKTMNSNQTFEKSKVEKYSIASIIKKMNNRTLRYDHPLQRESDQHSTKMKSNLMSDILQGNPIPALVFAEQVINGISITWNLDGKQRSTNVKEFTEDKFKITKSVRRNMIKYQAILKDEDGNIIPDEQGFPQAEWREFDISNKRFSQLPDELKEKFMDYCFDVTLYMNCSDEDIAYHIERYNDGKQMASSQKGVIKLGEDYARMIKGISAMPFFSENGFNYTQKKNGTIDRVCIESVMATEFLDNWKSSPEEIATYLKKNATEEHFDNLEDTVERLEKVVTDNIGELFDKKDAFIYFSVFARFKKTGLDDGKFVEFLTEYAQSLHNEFEKIEYDQENKKKRSTKDKCVVIDKINFVEKLMKEYLHIQEDETENLSTEEFISKVVDIPVDTVKEEIEVYEEDLKSLQDNAIKDGSKLLEIANHLSLLAMVAYSYKNDVTLDYWLAEYAAKNNTYIVNQRKNYLHMINDLEQYQRKMAVA